MSVGVCKEQVQALCQEQLPSTVSPMIHWLECRKVGAEQATLRYLRCSRQQRCSFYRWSSDSPPGCHCQWTWEHPQCCRPHRPSHTGLGWPLLQHCRHCRPLQTPCLCPTCLFASQSPCRCACSTIQQLTFTEAQPVGALVLQHSTLNTRQFVYIDSSAPKL